MLTDPSCFTVNIRAIEKPACECDLSANLLIKQQISEVSDVFVCLAKIELSLAQEIDMTSIDLLQLDIVDTSLIHIDVGVTNSRQNVGTCNRAIQPKNLSLFSHAVSNPYAVYYLKENSVVISEERLCSFCHTNPIVSLF